MRKSVFAAVVASVLAGAAAPAVAQATSDDDRFGVGLSVGMLGTGIDGSYAVSDRLSIRANANYGRYEMPGWLALTSSIADIPYDYDLRLLTVGVLADYHVLGSAQSGNGMVLTGGLYYNANRFDLVTTPFSNLTIGGTSYTPAEIGTLTADLDFERSFAPYLGIGLETNFFTDLPVSVFTRAGILFQGPADVSMAASGGGVSAADIASEESDLEDSLGFLEVFPIVWIGATVRF